jgi:hypothetical protein
MMQARESGSTALERGRLERIESLAKRRRGQFRQEIEAFLEGFADPLERCSQHDDNLLVRRIAIVRRSNLTLIWCVAS